MIVIYLFMDVPNTARPEYREYLFGSAATSGLLEPHPSLLRPLDVSDRWTITPLWPLAYAWL
jgi:hypothetical protein